MSERPFVIIHPAALEEAEKATLWYRERSAAAAVQFLGEINRAIDHILDAPRRWPAGPHGSRKLLLHRFPFAIIYRESLTAIQILAHGHRRPGYWKSRI